MKNLLIAVLLVLAFGAPAVADVSNGVFYPPMLLDGNGTPIEQVWDGAGWLPDSGTVGTVVSITDTVGANVTGSTVSSLTLGAGGTSVTAGTISSDSINPSGLNGLYTLAFLYGFNPETSKWDRISADGMADASENMDTGAIHAMSHAYGYNEASGTWDRIRGDSVAGLDVSIVPAQFTAFDTRTLDTTVVQVIDFGSDYSRVTITADTEIVVSPDDGSALTALNGDLVAAFSPHVYSQRLRYASIIVRSGLADVATSAVRVRAVR